MQFLRINGAGMRTRQALMASTFSAFVVLAACNDKAPTPPVAQDRSGQKAVIETPTPQPIAEPWNAGNVQNAMIEIQSSAGFQLEVVQGRQSNWVFTGASKDGSIPQSDIRLEVTADNQPPTMNITSNQSHQVTVTWQPAANEFPQFRTGTLNVRATSMQGNGSGQQSFTWTSNGTFTGGNGGISAGAVIISALLPLVQRLLGMPQGGMGIGQLGSSGNPGIGMGGLMGGQNGLCGQPGFGQQGMGQFGFDQTGMGQTGFGQGQGQQPGWNQGGFGQNTGRGSSSFGTATNDPFDQDYDRDRLDSWGTNNDRFGSGSSGSVGRSSGFGTRSGLNDDPFDTRDRDVIRQNGSDSWDPSLK
jgi:hypothetical protein